MQDYSAHKINAHKHLKEMQLLLLKNNFDEALKQADEAIVQLRMAKASITDLKEKHARSSDGFK
jgi:DNA polymerase III delta prime subunit